MTAMTTTSQSHSHSPSHHVLAHHAHLTSLPYLNSLSLPSLPLPPPPDPLSLDPLLALDPTEAERRQQLEYDESDLPALPQLVTEQRVAELSLASLPVPRTSKVWHTRMGNFLALERTIYTPQDWQTRQRQTSSVSESQSPSQSQAQDKPDRAPVPDENVIRWRGQPGGNGRLQSNARLIRWSDGSHTLQIGSEQFDAVLAPEPSARAGAHGLTYLTASHA